MTQEAQQQDETAARGREASELNELLEGWRDIDSAPRDGTVIQARIPGNGSDNMIVWVDGLLDSDGIECGGWAFANEEQEPPQCWTDGICWEVNEDGEQSVKPTYWKPSNAEVSSAHE